MSNGGRLEGNDMREAIVWLCLIVCSITAINTTYMYFDGRASFSNFRYVILASIGAIVGAVGILVHTGAI